MLQLEELVALSMRSPLILSYLREQILLMPLRLDSQCQAKHYYQPTYNAQSMGNQEFV